MEITSLNAHFTSENLSTRWRGRSKRGRVCIKVCNPLSEWASQGFQILAMKKEEPKLRSVLWQIQSVIFWSHF